MCAIRHRHKATITWQLERSRIIIKLNTTRKLVQLQHLPAMCMLLQLPLNKNCWSLDEDAEERDQAGTSASAAATLIMERIT